MSRVWDVGPRVRYWNFGYVPGLSWKANLVGRLIGHRNVMKRLQAPDVMDALDLQPHEEVLDLGCGAGYFTVEMAKRARRVVGLDVDPGLASRPVPRRLAGRLEYRVARGESLPFPAESFDVVLASEVLPMLPDPGAFLVEIHRVVRPGGRVVVVNGAGHPVIAAALGRRGLGMRLLGRAFPSRMPRTYADYCAALQSSFATARRGFLTERDLGELLEFNGLSVRQVRQSPRHVAGAYLSWMMFLRYLVTGRTLSDRLFVVEYPLLALASRLARAGYPGGLILVATRA